jgi:hypothetical protein
MVRKLREIVRVAETGGEEEEARELCQGRWG